MLGSQAPEVSLLFLEHLLDLADLFLDRSDDLFILTLRDLALAAKAGERERFQAAPSHAPRRRLDETRAARQPVLRWTRPRAV